MDNDGRTVYEVPFHQIPDELVRDERTNVYHIAVFSALAMHANKQRQAWPSYKRLSGLCGCSRSKVKATVAELQDMRWIKVHYRMDQETGINRTNIYALSPSLQRGAHDARGVGHTATEGGAHDDPEPDPLNQTHSEPEGEAPLDTGCIQDVSRMDTVKAAFIESISQLLPTTAWPDIPKQMAAITDMAQMTRDTQPTTPIETPEQFAQLVVSTYCAMKRKAKSDYWKTASFEPKAIKRRFGDVVTELANLHGREQEDEAGMAALRRMGKL